MTEPVPEEVSRKHRDLMLRVARRPGFCCCCVCIPSGDRRRARRIFRITRRVTRAWEKEAQEQEQEQAQKAADDKTSS
jgi:hypothetical protein